MYQRSFKESLEVVESELSEHNITGIDKFELYKINNSPLE